MKLARGALLIGVHERPGDFPSLFALEGRRAVELHAPAGARLDVAGVSP